MTRAPYDKEAKQCFRYRIDEKWLDNYIKAGEDYLLNFNRIKDEPFINEFGEQFKKFIKPFTKAAPTQIDLGYGIDWLTRERMRIISYPYTSPQERQAEYRRYIHNLNCFQGIVERLVAANWKKRQAHYSQQLFQPDEGLRLYEKGGGLQCASKNFREYLLISSPVLNVDAVKCHATIAHHETERRGLDAGLKALLEGKFQIAGSALTIATQKISGNQRGSPVQLPQTKPNNPKPSQKRPKPTRSTGHSPIPTTENPDQRTKESPGGSIKVD
jgi:hypothetical protein